MEHRLAGEQKEGAVKAGLPLHEKGGAFIGKLISPLGGFAQQLEPDERVQRGAQTAG
jgi:hypothetical protein